MNTDTENTNLVLHKLNTYTEMMEAVANASIASSVTTVAGTLYQQGGRYCFQTALDLQALSALTMSTRVKTTPSGTTSINEVRGAKNRPMDKEHARAIGKYIVTAASTSHPYILPSLTLNFDQPVDVYTLKGEASTRAAVMIMPIGIRMDITDGQHRIEGVNQAIAATKELDQDAVGAMITFTGKLEQIHQDFADCAKTKPITPSVLATYDMRNLANCLAMDVVDKIDLFNRNVDAVRKTVSARSVAVWTTNQIKIMLKWALIGSQCGDDVFARNAESILIARHSEQYNAFIQGIDHAIQIMCTHNPTMNILSKVTRDSIDQVPKIRESENSILMTGSGLSVWAYLWNKLRVEKREKPSLDTDFVMRQIAGMDWSHTSLMFRDNLKLNPERTQSGAKYVKRAGETMWGQIKPLKATAA